MPLPKKPRVPIYTSPAQFIALANSVKIETAAQVTVLANFGEVEKDNLSDFYDEAAAAYVESQDALNTYKTLVITRNQKFDTLASQMRVLRDSIWAQFPQNPEVVADWGFDIFVSPAARRLRLPAVDFEVEVPPAGEIG